MKEKNIRIKAIKDIINNNRIDSQETLLKKLSETGCQVTQATLSRDLKLLKVGKISDGNTGYYYSLPGDKEIKETEKNFIFDFQRGFLSLDFSENICVIKTLPGHANSVALSLDNFSIDEVLGTVAGDDTIIIVLKEKASRNNFVTHLKNKIPDIEV